MTVAVGTFGEMALSWRCMLPNLALYQSPPVTFRFTHCCTGEERFAKRPNEGRVAELEALQEFLKDAVAAFDAQQATIVAPLDRMKLLLTSKDKRATLLEMAGVGFALVSTNDDIVLSCIIVYYCVLHVVSKASTECFDMPLNEIACYLCTKPCEPLIVDRCFGTNV